MDRRSTAQRGLHRSLGRAQTGSHELVEDEHQSTLES